ncbi:MAG: ATP synthase F1 subunit epsilon [Eubacterium sp.]|nr:ATP synthase F1 subunit epsilon [Eubacterium sp.]
MAELKQFRLEVISPERIFYTGDVEMVELSTTEGDIGILAGHIPLTTIVAPGVLTISGPDNKKKEAAVLEGFMEITGDKVTILAQSCEWPDEIDVERAIEARERAERRLKSSDANINLARAELALKKSLVRLELADKKS